MARYAADVGHRLLPAALCAAGLALAAPQALAQTVDDHLREGFALRQRGAEAEALARFEAAWALAQTPRVAAQVGLTHQALGHWVEADRFLRLATDAADDPWVRRSRPALDAALRVVRQHLGELELAGEPAGAVVSLDGRVVGTLPLAAPLRVIAGTVNLEVRAEGHVPVQRRLVVDPGAALREEVSLVRVPEAPPAAATAATATATATAAARRGDARGAAVVGASPMRVLGIALVSVGGAATAFGVAAVALRESAAADYNTRCPSPRPGLSVDCQGLLDAESTWGAARWIGLAAGGALLVGGVSALVLDLRAPRRAAWRCAPGWASVACELRF
jgi:hypothetical protein